jgi:hypothetical protein
MSREGLPTRCTAKAAFFMSTRNRTDCVNGAPRPGGRREKGLHGKPQKLCESVQIRKNPCDWLNAEVEGSNRWLASASRNGGRADTHLLCHGVGGFSGRDKAVHTHLTRG